jgi:hypothetical protein
MKIILEFFKRRKVETSSNQTGAAASRSRTGIKNAEEKIRSLKKEATQLKKNAPLDAAKKISEAIQLSIASNTPPGLDTELRYVRYLHIGGERDASFNELARLMKEGTALDPPRQGSSHWYSDQHHCLLTRINLLKKENTKESWSQCIYDSFLATYYDAMFYIKLRSKAALPEQNERNLKFALKFDNTSDLEKVCWKGFKSIGLAHKETELLKLMQEWAKSEPKLKIEPVTKWLDETIRSENL